MGRYTSPIYPMGFWEEEQTPPFWKTQSHPSNPNHLGHQTIIMESILFFFVAQKSTNGYPP